MNVYSITFNVEKFKMEAEIYRLLSKSLDQQYEELVGLLDTDGIDVVDYNDDFIILVDDRGFEKEYNPVFEIITEDGIAMNFAGKVLFAKNIYNEYSTDIGGLTLKEIKDLRDTLNIRFLGLLEGESN